MKPGIVKSVSKSPTHTMIKPNFDQIVLLKALGVEGDAHMGTTVKHRSRVAKDPTQPNLRQVHLIHSELHEELLSQGLEVLPGQMGENITTSGIPLLDLPKDTLLKIGDNAIIQITGLRNPCYQLDGIVLGLLQAVVSEDEEGNIVRKAGIMGIVVEGGIIKTGDTIVVSLPTKPYIRLEKV